MYIIISPHNVPKIAHFLAKYFQVDFGGKQKIDTQFYVEVWKCGKSAWSFFCTKRSRRIEKRIRLYMNLGEKRIRLVKNLGKKEQAMYNVLSWKKLMFFLCYLRLIFSVSSRETKQGHRGKRIYKSTTQTTWFNNIPLANTARGKGHSIADKCSTIAPAPVATCRVNVR